MLIMRQPYRDIFLFMKSRGRGSVDEHTILKALDNHYGLSYDRGKAIVENAVKHGLLVVMRKTGGREVQLKPVTLYQLASVFNNQVREDVVERIYTPLDIDSVGDAYPSQNEKDTIWLCVIEYSRALDELGVVDIDEGSTRMEWKRAGISPIKLHPMATMPDHMRGQNDKGYLDKALRLGDYDWKLPAKAHAKMMEKYDIEAASMDETLDSPSRGNRGLYRCTANIGYSSITM